MEAPPFPAAPTANTITPTAAESVDSSPRSRKTNSWDADPPPTQKLRLMCSYGGHIVPRPHDKTLCYIGGDTRIIVIERYVSLSDLRHHLSKTLLHNQPFILKYQLPNEDLDSLISVATDEDLENMVEEYDRLSNAAPKNGRLRVFLFPKTSLNNIEQLLVETTSTKSEDWFFNALNGKGSTLSAGASDRGFSESSSVNNLLGFEDDLVGKVGVAGKEVDPQIEGSKSGNNNNVPNYDGNFSVPDSPLMETTSSFGSTSSTPSVGNLPPVRVHVDENPKVGLGIEDHFLQMNLGVAGNANLVAAASGTVLVAPADYPNRVFSDDERSDPGGYRKVPQSQPQVQRQLPVPQFQQKPAPLQYDLATPDSVSSEGSIANPLSRQRQATYQESVFQVQSGNPSVTTTTTTPADPKILDQNNPKIQIQESNYVRSGQCEQNHPQMHHPQHFIHGGNQYAPTGAMPIASYYPIYPSQPQNHPHQQYPFYFAPASRQTQGYNNIPMQQSNNYNELPNTPSSRPLTPPTGTAPYATYNQSKPEISTGFYQTAAGLGPQTVQGPRYAGFTQMHQPSQSMAPPSGTNSNSAYEFTDPSHTQMYYNQAVPPQFSGHYQTLTSVPSVVVSDASGKVPTESMKPQVRNLQP